LPEGHTIHRLARDHARWFGGEPVRVSSPQGRFADAARLLDGAVLTGTDAVGKHLFHRYEHGAIVHVHLGLFGRFLHHPTPPPEPRDTVRYRVIGSERTADLVGATACELLDLDGVDRIAARLGPDPLRRDADPDRAFAALQRRSVPIGRALLDQAVVAGVGNVYRAELLFVHGLHPLVPARTVTAERWAAMWDTLVTWMRSGVRMRRIVTVDPDEVGTARSRIRRGAATYVYRQEVCRRCGTPVRRWDLAGRWAYACETCQPPPRPDA
jgi:endonuclease VIII